jgi:hypothetical protein
MEHQLATQSTQKEQQQKSPFSTSLQPNPAERATTHPLLRLQRSVGNQAVQRMVREGGTGLQTQLGINRYGPGAKALTSTTSPFVLQRKCACGGTIESHASVEECDECKAKREATLQRSVANRSASPAATTVPPIVHNVLSSSGQPLDAGTRAFMEPRFRHDFSGVRVHTDARAAESARAVNALAYTVGNKIVFGAGQYMPETMGGKRLLAHELTHVVQQQGKGTAIPQTQEQITPMDGGGYRIAVAPEIREESEILEHQADKVAEHVVGLRDQVVSNSDGTEPLIGGVSYETIQRVRLPLPNPIPLCGKTLTHIDVELPRWRPLEPCLPASVLVFRMNIVGRDLSVPTPTKGPQVFNLHIGYYRDPATGRLCGIIDDSKTCIAPRCAFLGCFPTLREVIDAIVDFLKSLLEFIGILLLVILLILLGGELIKGGEGGEPIPGLTPEPVIASADEEPTSDSTSASTLEPVVASTGGEETEMEV